MMKSSRLTIEERQERRQTIMDKRKATVNSLRYVFSGFHPKTGKTYPRQSKRQAERYAAL